MSRRKSKKRRMGCLYRLFFLLAGLTFCVMCSQITFLGESSIFGFLTKMIVIFVILLIPAFIVAKIWRKKHPKRPKVVVLDPDDDDYRPSADTDDTIFL